MLSQHAMEIELNREKSSQSHLSTTQNKRILHTHTLYIYICKEIYVKIIVEHQKDFPSLCHVSSLVRIIHVFSVCFFRS